MSAPIATPVTTTGAAATRDALPDFIVIGAEKTGTTSLHAYLSDHPEIYMPSIKEVRFFDLDRHYERGLDWYREFFRSGVAAGARVLGEASPGYFHFPQAVARMHAVVPDARLVLVVRDPVPRAYSHYWHRVRGGHERRSFAQLVADHLEGREASFVLDISRYADHLERVLAHYPRERVLVTFTERLESDRAAVCSGIFAFLGVDPAWRPRNLDAVKNPAALPRSRAVQRLLHMNTPVKRWLKRRMSAAAWMAFSRRMKRLNYRRFAYPPLDPTLAARLRAYYRDADDRLRATVGHALPWDAADDGRAGGRGC